MYNFDKIKEQLENNFQAEWNRIVRPLIVAEMKRLGIKAIKQVMGVDFITLNNGKSYADDELADISLKYKKFLDEFVYPWNDQPYYNMIDHDIKL
jgi:hypothetical protein